MIMLAPVSLARSLTFTAFDLSLEAEHPDERSPTPDRLESSTIGDVRASRRGG